MNTQGRLFMRRLLAAGLIILGAAGLSLYIKGHAIAVDPPHNDTSTSIKVYCNSCHSVHKAPGPNLTNNASNANLCLSCHTGSNPKRMDTGMQASPWTTKTGTSHRWDGMMPTMNGANNPYGLRWTTGLSSNALKTQLATYGNVVTCSVCHNQHSQASTPWDPNAPAYTTTTRGWVTAGGRNFQRITDDYNQMCEDCHYYRTTGWTTDVRTYTGNYQSHPIVKIFSSANGETPNVSNPGQFQRAPMEPVSSWSTLNYSWQTGSRYHINGNWDTNAVNNIVVDSSKQLRCLSCHGVHYTNSDSTGTGQP